MRRTCSVVGEEPRADTVLLRAAHTITVVSREVANFRQADEVDAAAETLLDQLATMVDVMRGELRLFRDALIEYETGVMRNDA